MSRSKNYRERLIASLTEKMDTMSVLKVGLHKHVVRISDDSISNNYLGTGKVLVGILKDNETLAEFKKRWFDSRLKSA